MIRHIVWWTLKGEDEVEVAANARRILEAARELGGIPGLASVEVSIEVQKTSTVPARVVLQSSHADMDALAAYAAHPAHQAFLAVVKGVAASRQALDYSID